MSFFRLVDGIESCNQTPTDCRAKLKAAQVAYRSGELQQCRYLLLAAHEIALNLKDNTFGLPACNLGLACIDFADGATHLAKNRVVSLLSYLENPVEPIQYELKAAASNLLATILIIENNLIEAEKALDVALASFLQLGATKELEQAYIYTRKALVKGLQEKFIEAQKFIEKSSLLLNNCHEDNFFNIFNKAVQPVCYVTNCDDMLDRIKECICIMQYQLDARNPELVFAVSWYLHKREQRGEDEKIIEANQSINNKTLELARRAKAS